MKEDRKRWDGRFKGSECILGRKASPFLKKYIRLLPRGKALDLAAGEGRNALFLAEHGFEVEAVDISRAGLSKARRSAKARGVKLKTIVADLDTYSIARGVYDLIVDFYFLDRGLIPAIKRGLKKGGRVVLETYTTEQDELGVGGPSTRRYLLKPNELLHLFRGLRILLYREGIFREGGGRKAVASLIAEKV